MGKADKLLKRFLQRPKDFSFKELNVMLGRLGYEKISKGKTSGSRVAFLHHHTKHIIRLHKPHPDPVLKRYQIDEIIAELHKRGVVE